MTAKAGVIDDFAAGISTCCHVRSTLDFSLQFAILGVNRVGIVLPLPDHPDRTDAAWSALP